MILVDAGLGAEARDIARNYRDNVHLTKMETIKIKMIALKEKNELVMKELDVVTKLRNTIVEVNIIIITVNAHLQHGQKMANGKII